MTEFVRADLTGARFEHSRLRDALFQDVTLAGARIRNADLTGLVVRGAWLHGLELSGEVEGGLLVNGVDVAPYVEAELDRRYPDRALMRPSTAEEFRRAWDALERLWPETVERMRALPEERLHERVDGEWSVIENLRHLVFATDAWVRRAVLGDPAPWSPLDLPNDEMDPTPGVPWDRDARPSLDEVLALRADRMATVRTVLADLTDERLASMTEPVTEPGYPESESFPVFRCLYAIVNEEWEHRLYVERTLDAVS